MKLLRWFRLDLPHRQAVCALVQQLPPLPDQEQRTVRRVPERVQIQKPMTLTAWYAKHEVCR